MANGRGLSLQFRILAVESHRSADHLDHFGTGPLSQLPGGLFRPEIGPLPELDLDQLPRAQGIVERLNDGIGKPLPSHVHRGREVVGFRSEGSSIFPFHDLSRTQEP
jgi:hypothetical protein